MSNLPTNTVELEYYLHDLFLKANSNLTHTNIGPRIGRYLCNLRSKGTIQDFKYHRDEDNKLKTIITVGSEPNQISTFLNVMNKLYLQEKKWSKIKL
jgi:hypothetical protein